MTDFDLSYDGLCKSLEEIVAEKGEDYVYGDDPETIARREANGGGELNEDCYYAGKDGSTPGCIIGHLVHKFVPNLDLNSLDGWGAGGAMRAAGLPVVDKELALLNNLQRFQDTGKPWGQSLADAKAIAENKYGKEN